MRLPRGRMLLLTRKSSRSSTQVPLPRGSKPLQILKPKTQGRDSRIMPITAKGMRRRRSPPVSSQMLEIIISNTAITVDIAAKSMKRKKRVPQIRPPFIALKTLGRVMKSRFGPASGWIPKLKHAGKIIRPATIATKVSRNIIHRASLVSFCSLPM